MPEPVIVDAVRTPIGRAFKGSLAQVRPDETGAFIVDQLLERNPDVDPASQEDGFFDREIVPVPLGDGNEAVKDDGPRASSTLEKLAQLEPAFREGGKVTAGNSCPLNDGAAATLIMSADRAKELGLQPRARIVTAATAAL